MRYVLKIAEGDRRDRKVGVSAGLIIGRAHDCSVRLQDPKVSAHHLSITITGGMLYLTDLKSTNGFWIDGEEYCEPGSVCPLKDGLVVNVGGVRMEFREVGTLPKSIKTPPVLQEPDREVFSTSFSSSGDELLGNRAFAGRGPGTVALDDSGTREIAQFTYIKDARPRLVILGDGPGRIEAINTALVKVGRESGPGALELDHETVSAKHAKITMFCNHFFVADRGSKNHTFIWVGTRKELLRETERELTAKTWIAFGRVDALFMANLDPDNQNISFTEFDVALLILQERGLLDSDSVEAAEEEAARNQVHPAELLLANGRVSLTNFQAAVEAAKKRISGGDGGGWSRRDIYRIALILAILALAIIIALKF